MGGLESIYILPHGIPSRVECNDEAGTGAFRPCDRCRSTLFDVEPGSGPHYLALRCTGCGKDHRWLDEAQAEGIKHPSAYFEQANEVVP